MTAQVSYREATVRDFDVASRAGSVLLDDGRELAFPAGTLDGQVRLLRCGQRVLLRLLTRLDQPAHPAVAVTAVTMTAFGARLHGE